MNKKGIFHQQETMETCGISCILMALTAFGKIRKPKAPMPGEESVEAVLYKMYGFDVGNGKKMGTLGSAIAYALAVRRLNVVLMHESENYLENRDGYFPSELHEKMLAAHKAYIEKAQGAFAVRAGERIDVDVLIEELGKERLLIVQCLVNGDADGMHDKVLHWILVFDYVDGRFRAYNPSYERPNRKAPNYIEITPEEMQDYMTTPVSAAVISVGEK